MSPKQRLKLNVSAMHPGDKLILTGNALLGQGRSREAILQYTEVLYQEAPGHIIALLNRCMGYKMDNRPDLAATDAYRACQCLDDIKDLDMSMEKTRQRLVEIRRYLRIEELHPGFRQIPGPQGTWTAHPLAALRINHPELPLRSTWEPHLVVGRLQARAIFRLCGALTNCGLSTAPDVWGIIDDATNSFRWTPEETSSLRALGNNFLKKIDSMKAIWSAKAKLTNDDDVILLPSELLHLEPGSYSPVLTLQSAMKSRTASQPALPKYWADIFEPDFSKESGQEDLKLYTSKSSKTCEPVVIDGSLDPHMRATEDHRSGDTLINERSPWHVHTSGSTQAIQDSVEKVNGRLRVYCDTCATVLLLPVDMIRCLVSATWPMEDRIAHAKESDRDEASERRRKWCTSSQISICDAKEHQVFYCSKECRRLRRSFDSGLHQESLEQDLRTRRQHTAEEPRRGLSHPHPHSLYNHSKVQTLYDLLFLRIYASAYHQDEHPLDVVAFVPGNNHFADLKPIVAQDVPADKVLQRVPTGPAWSFEDNIVRPISAINRFHIALGQDPMEYLSVSDGSVVQTLLRKIHSSAQISRGAMSAIIYDVDKECKSHAYRGLEEWISPDDDAVYNTEEEFGETWVALLDPVVAMVKIADESKGEKPNCWLKYDQGVRVIAGQPDDPPDVAGPAVKKGETLLRAKPEFLGGSPYEVRAYTQADPTRPAEAESNRNIHHESGHPLLHTPQSTSHTVPHRSSRLTIPVGHDKESPTSSAEDFQPGLSEGFSERDTSDSPVLSEPSTPPTPPATFADQSQQFRPSFDPTTPRKTLGRLKEEGKARKMRKLSLIKSLNEAGGAEKKEAQKKEGEDLDGMDVDEKKKLPTRPARKSIWDPDSGRSGWKDFAEGYVREQEVKDLAMGL
ncbi:MAG: hypothetical protein Q9174_003947 [Haloplaca sp. 1 TL-2023]